MEKIIEQPKRYVPIAEYQRISGLSYATVNHMLNTGQLQFITTETGLRRVDTQQVDSAIGEIILRLEVQEGLLKRLCEHLGVSLDQ